MSRANLFHGTFPVQLAEQLHGLNPHWQGEPGPPIPSARRPIFSRVLRLLAAGLTPATVLLGPRHAGKTVLLRQICEQLLQDGVGPRRILYVSFEKRDGCREIRDPVLSIARWFEETVANRSLNELAREGRIAFLLLDEVQNLNAWAPQVKHLLDNHEARALVTCRFSRRTEAELVRLAGRIMTVRVGPFTPSEIGDSRTLENDE